MISIFISLGCIAGLVLTVIGLALALEGFEERLPLNTNNIIGAMIAFLGALLLFSALLVFAQLRCPPFYVPPAK